MNTLTKSKNARFDIQHKWVLEEHDPCYLDVGEFQWEPREGPPPERIPDDNAPYCNSSNPFNVTLKPKDCSLTPTSSVEFSQCLSGLHLCFIGDSLTEQLYSDMRR